MRKSFAFKRQCRICQAISIIRRRKGAIDGALCGRRKATVESCRSIDVLDWHRRGYLRSPRWFSWAWTRDGERVASINVETQRHSVTLKYRSRSMARIGAIRAAGPILDTVAIENSSAFAGLLGKVLPSTLAMPETSGGAPTVSFERIIVWPDGHREVEGVTPKQLPSPGIAQLPGVGEKPELRGRTGLSD